MVDFAIVREWIVKAEEDFLFAESSLRGGSEFYAQICFHFQQSAEKYLKAFILAKGLPFEKVHDLVYLLKICSKHEPRLDSLREDCILLGTAYIETRYPVHWPTSYTRETAEQARIAAANVARSVRQYLSCAG